MTEHPNDVVQAANDLWNEIDSIGGSSAFEPASRYRFDLVELDVRWEASQQTLWTFMTPTGRPAFNPAILKDLQAWQQEIRRIFTPDADPIKYIVLGSRYPGVFNLGGDLEFVANRAENRDVGALIAYGNSCVDVLYQNLTGLDLPVVTIALIQGDAIGGGFESALSFDVLIAERSARFSLPENMFGMFPGVGAHSILTRKLGFAQAERLMLSGKTYTAEEMYALGIVHTIAEDSQGERAVHDYIAQNSKRQGGHHGIYRAAREINPITLDELQRVVKIWAETALRLKPQDIRMMRRLAGMQTKLASARSVSAPLPVLR